MEKRLYFLSIILSVFLLHNSFVSQIFAMEVKNDSSNNFSFGAGDIPSELLLKKGFLRVVIGTAEGEQDYVKMEQYLNSVAHHKLFANKQIKKEIVSAFSVASEKNLTEVVRVFLNYEEVFNIIPNSAIYQALCNACETKNLDIFNLILSHDINNILSSQKAREILCKTCKYDSDLIAAVILKDERFKKFLIPVKNEVSGFKRLVGENSYFKDLLINFLTNDNN